MAFQRSKTGTPLGGTASSATARLPGTTTSGRMISRASCAYPSQLCPRPFPVRVSRTGGSSSPRAAELLAVPRTGMMCPSRSAPSRASCPPPTRRSPPRACASSRAMTMCSRTAVPPRNPRFSTPCSSSQIQALAREPACERASCSERTQGSSRGSGKSRRICARSSCRTPRAPALRCTTTGDGCTRGLSSRRTAGVVEARMNRTSPHDSAGSGPRRLTSAGSPSPCRRRGFAKQSVSSWLPSTASASAVLPNGAQRPTVAPTPATSSDSPPRAQTLSLTRSTTSSSSSTTIRTEPTARSPNGFWRASSRSSTATWRTSAPSNARRRAAMRPAHRTSPRPAAPTPRTPGSSTRFSTRPTAGRASARTARRSSST